MNANFITATFVACGFMFLSQPSHSQSPSLKQNCILSDAIFIRNNLNETSKRKKVNAILCRYNLNESELDSNKFLKSFGFYCDSTEMTMDFRITENKNLTESLSSIGGIDVSMVADAFASFIVKRTKQELSIAFFDKFTEVLENQKDLQTVFPQTYRTLSVIGDQIYLYETYLHSLRISFEKDLHNLPENLPSIIENHQEFFRTMPELKAILESAFYISREIQQKQHPGIIIENYPLEYLENNGVDSNVIAGMQTLKLLSKSLRSENVKSGYWTSAEDIKRLISDDTTLIIYLGLLKQQASIDNINFKKQSLADIINNTYDLFGNNLPKYRLYFKELAFKIKVVENTLAELEDDNLSDSLKFEKYYSFINASISLMKYMAQVENLPGFPDDWNIQEKTKEYFYIAQTASEIVIDVNRRNYASAIINTCNLYHSIFEKDSNPDYETLVSTNILRYGTFMVNVSMAKTSEDVQVAIEYVALPVGSARIKRETDFNVSLNAYCGLYGGFEYIQGIDPKSFKINSFGVSAPIGLSLSTGKRKFFGIPCGRKGRFSHTLFLSFFDIGALASFRFKDDNTKTVPQIQLKDIISPGIFYSLGIPKSPVSFNVGYQIGPLLREVTETQNTYSQHYSRVSISLVVDIPLLNFYTGQRRLLNKDNKQSNKTL